ncbi:uncharacterized protein LOC115218424 isoform X2 [Octopus sinensis]|uniref:Uncharacterized protein LOC115218424 isoform X2 n=1 Tax=Octopus sinensis TaxID=2607531 RepID=A0A6P7T157_9MOLL|nr:uncharacterized protein LOC115218424 isoform X2 [Octopus sinensis]
MRKHITTLIFLSNIIICASKTWTYEDNLGDTEYCCICDKDFIKEETIQECYIKNKNDPRQPFCNCNKGRLPKCSKSATICNRQITCPANLAYQNCAVPFVGGAKLVCNDSLLWEPLFTCPECPENTTVCNRQITCPERLYYQECKVPFVNNATLNCSNSLKWESNFTCPECPENTIICNRPVTCPERHYYKECKVPFVDNGKLVCGENLEWKPLFTCPDPESPILAIILGILFGVALLIIIIAGAVCCLRRRRSSGITIQRDSEEYRPQDTGIITPDAGQDPENGIPLRPLPNGNAGGDAENNEGNDIPGQDPEDGGQDIPLLNGNAGDNAGGNEGDDIPVPNGSEERGSGSVHNSSCGEDEGDFQPLISMTSGIEETGSNSGNEDITNVIRPLNVHAVENDPPNDAVENDPPNDRSILYADEHEHLPLSSLSADSYQDLNNMEMNI